MSKQAIYGIRGKLTTVTMAELAHLLTPGERFCTANAHDPASAQGFLAGKGNGFELFGTKPYCEH